ncbi:MAG TPA: long-chain fatty acid--CoA ligase [Polyangiales bacterium]|nr:long-chain fatty acid--CoA ligase [Polyangiales bacterium]
MARDTIPARLFERSSARGDEPAYFVKENGVWQATSWAGYARDVRRAAHSLIALGIEPGHTVAMLGGNRPEWSTMLLAAISIGARGAGLYTTSSSAELQSTLAHTNPRVLLVENEALFARVREVLAPSVQRVVFMRGAPAPVHALASSWDGFLKLGAELDEAQLDARVEALDPAAAAVLVYTSGTEGAPQAVMLSHRNLTWTSDVVRDVLRAGPGDTSLSYLPLSHVSEQMFTVHGPITTGGAVYYAESVARAPANLREVQPTIVFGVPRIWEKLHDGMEQRLAREHGPRARVVQWARAIGLRYVTAKNEGREPSLELSVQYELARKLVLERMHRGLGLSNARICLSGAAPIDEEVLIYFASLGVQILEVYGQSECSGPATLNQPARARLGSVGPKLPGTTIALAEDGEVLISGPHVFLGYDGDPEATAQALREGVLHTGDLGEIDGEGFLTITGRKREILITAGGKNVAPKRIEEALKRSPLIAEAVVIGDRRRYLTALITLEAPGDVREQIEAHVAKVNEELARVEQIKRFTILPRAFDVENGELTPTMKVKRRRVEEVWAKEIDALYTEDAASARA